MGKRLTSSVHFGDSETGENRVLAVGEKVSAKDKALMKKGGWTDERLAAILEDDGTDDDDFPEDGPSKDEQEDAEKALAAGHPHEDTASPVSDAPGIKSAMDVNEETRTKANPAGVEDSEGKPKGRRNVGG